MNIPQRSTTAISSEVTLERGLNLTLSQQVFEKLTARINAHSGIVYSAGKRQLVETRLRKRLRALKLDSFEAYLAHLDAPGGNAEIAEMINVSTTNLTSFFREEHHFTDMAQFLMAGKRDAGSNRRTRIWSAACSTGEEPYSIAITALQAGLASPGSDLRILATDLDTDALKTARAATYPVQRLKFSALAHRDKYFDDQSASQVRLKKQVQNLISFNQLNLHQQWPVTGPFDIIFCRNVLIYFGDADKRSIVSRFIKLLRPGGTLYLGHSESMLGNHPELIKQGRTIFRKQT